MPFIADLEACKRVSTNGLTFFRRMVGEYHAQIVRTLQGKSASTNVETYRFADRLKQVQAELNSQRDTHFLDLSLEDRDLKEKVEKLQGLQEELNKVNNKISDQAKQLEELRKAKEERHRAWEAQKELRKEGAQLREEVELLAKGKVEAEKRVATASAAAFQQAMNLTRALAPWVDWKFFDGKHYAKDKKIWLGDEMVHDPALHRKAEEEDEDEDNEGSPEKENAEEDQVEDKAPATESAKMMPRIQMFDHPVLLNFPSISLLVASG